MRWDAAMGVRAAVVLFALFLLSACGAGGSSSGSDIGSSNGGDGTGITNTFSSPSEMGVGDIMSIDVNTSGSASVSFSGVASGTNFILAIGSYSSSGSGTSMQISGNLAAEVDAEIARSVGVEAPPPEDEGYGPQEILSAWLRSSEALLPAQMSAGERALPSKGMALKATQVGDTETFRVLSSLSSTSSYVEVTGEVRCIDDHVIFYVDSAVSESILSGSDVATLCQEFDGVAADEQALLGSISDVDSNGKFKVLMTKQINRLGAMGGGIVTGYFYAADLYVRSSSNPVSNYGEIIYTMVPDPNGIYGTAISNAFAMSNLLPAVLPHELQHAISYNQHVLVNGGATEENWLNEGLSHLSEDVLGYGIENPSRYSMYLASPSTYGVVTQGSPNLMERGAEYLFLRFLYEQASDGAAFLSALENTTSSGVTNLEAAFNGPSELDEFSEFMARWVVALGMTDRGISSDARFNYDGRTRNAQTGNWEGVCLDCDAEDNRGTTLDGVNLNTFYGSHNPSVDTSTAIFYEMTTLPNTMNVVGTQGGGGFGILIRTR